MTIRRIAAASFAFLVMYMVAVPMFLQAVGRTLDGSPLPVALSLGWYFALLGSLVSAMVFTIAYAGQSMIHDREEATSVAGLHRSDPLGLDEVAKPLQKAS